MSSVDKCTGAEYYFQQQSNLGNEITKKENELKINYNPQTAEELESLKAQLSYLNTQGNSVAGQLQAGLNGTADYYKPARNMVELDNKLGLSFNINPADKPDDITKQ